ncbi:MAG: class I SAM-dependent methyltransferase [Planctomycetia bacterium]|nr:class I SAM-dependent methyltransferase [Planctomycetia bacterium]
MRGTSHAGPRLIARFSDAVGRRARRLWHSITVGDRPPAAESALRWLRDLAGDGDGISPTCGSSAICPGLSAAAVATFFSFGETELAIRFARRLIVLQKRDGSLPDAGLLHGSLFNTAQAARAWGALLDAEPTALPEAQAALRRACCYLAGRVGDDGAIRLSASGGSFERWAPPIVHLVGFGVLADWAKRWNVPAWRDAVGRAVGRILRTEDSARPNAQSHIAAHGIEAFLNLASFDERCGLVARRALDETAAMQTTDGALPTDLVHPWTSSAGLAHYAALWFRSGRREAGDHAMTCLTGRQRDDGSWTGSWGRGAAYFPRSSSAWTAKYFLDAAAGQVADRFNDATLTRDPKSFAAPLMADDERLRAVDRVIGKIAYTFGSDASFVDVGCGTGRYLERLAARHPALRLTGIDPAPRLLEKLPPRATSVAGNLLHLPAADESYEGACCVEALEHALVPERAVAELCRIVRPGGRVVVIDKDARFQALSVTEAWERWFTPECVSAWLAKDCDDVTCEPLPVGPQQQTPGLFLCWTGVKRAASQAVSFRRAA